MKAPRQPAQVDAGFHAQETGGAAGPAAKLAQDDGGDHGITPTERRKENGRLTDLKT